MGELCVIVSEAVFELVVQIASSKAKSTGVSGVAVQPVVDNFPHHQIMFFAPDLSPDVVVQPVVEPPLLVVQVSLLLACVVSLASVAAENIRTG